MEPRPPRPSRPAAPQINTGTPPQAPGTPAYGQGGYGQPPAYGPGGTLGAGPFDASGAPPAGAPPIGYDPSYSPGQPLSPLNVGRGSRVVAPLLAVALLAVLVAGAAWAVTRVRGDDDGEGEATTVAAQTTAVATEAPGADDGGDDGGDGSEGERTAGGTADAAPTETPADGDDPAPTENPEAAADPTLTNGDLEATRRAEDAEDTPTPRPSRERDSARAWLPLTAEVGEGWRETDEQTRDLATTAGAFPDPADAEVQLTEWGWAENVYRQYELADADPAATNVYIVSVHRFETAQGARDALPYFFDGAALAGLDEARNLPNLGDSTRALQGVTSDGANQFVLYVREGDVIIRLAGTSLEGDPREDVLALAERILAE